MLDLEQKLRKTRIDLSIDFPFFGHLSLGLELIKEETLNPPTMGTDGIYLYWHPEFVKETSLSQLKGVMCHEVAHVFFLHPLRRQMRDMLKWNIACDYAINDLVLHEQDRSGKFLELPEGILYDVKYKGKSAEWIYNQLPDPQKGDAGTLDSHEFWEAWAKGQIKDKDGNTVTAAELEQKVRENVAAAVTAARMAGKLSNNIAEKVNGLLEPKLDWKTILREMVVSCVHNDFRLMPPSKKHLWRDLYLPATKGEELCIAAVIDTSGSISSKEIKDFLGEVYGICRAFNDYTVYLFMCDSSIKQRWELHPYDELPNIVTGRGGTSFKPPLEVVEKENLPISTMIYLTDLYPNDGFPPVPSFPVLWVSTTDVVPPWGEVIRINR